MMSEHRDQHGRGKAKRDQDAPENEVDRASADSFPASDPPSFSGITGTGNPDQQPDRPPSHERSDAERPKGGPTSDRHATETAHQWEDQDKPAEPARGRNP